MAELSSYQTDVVRQHTVPRFLLEKFAAPGKGKHAQFHAYDKHDGRRFVINTLNASVRKTFYNVVDHPDRISLEPLLGIYENDAAPVIAALLQHKDIRKLSNDDRHTLAVFVAVQRARTFGEQQRIEDMISGIAARVARIGATPDQVNAALGFTPERDLHNLFLQQLLEQASHIKHLLAKDWYLFETTPDHPFYISDNPVVLYNKRDTGPYGNLGLAVAGIQIYLPLSSTMTLGMFCPSIREQQIRLKRDIWRRMMFAPLTLPSGLNPTRRIANASAFIDFDTMPYAPDHVTWQNSLQVTFSEQYVFCENDSFSLVERMIADNPAYRTGPRFTIG